MTGELDPALRELLLLVNEHGSPAAVRALAGLLNGRDAVLKLHHRETYGDRECCAHCRDWDEEPTAWPCATAQALNARPSHAAGPADRVSGAGSARAGGTPSGRGGDAGRAP